MLASRFWYVFLGLLVGVATFLLFLATSMHEWQLRTNRPNHARIL